MFCWLLATSTPYTGLLTSFLVEPPFTQKYCACFVLLDVFKSCLFFVAQAFFPGMPTKMHVVGIKSSSNQISSRIQVVNLQQLAPQSPRLLKDEVFLSGGFLPRGACKAVRF